MPNSDVRNRMNDLDINSLAAIQRQLGRLEIDDGFRMYWLTRRREVLGIGSDRRYSLVTRRMADLLGQVTFSIATSGSEIKPNYYQYTDSHLLDWYLSPDFATLPDLKCLSIRGLYYLLRDLLQFESRSLGGFETYSQESFDRERVHSRIDLIEKAAAACNDASGSMLGVLQDPRLDIPPCKNLEDYAVQGSRLGVLIHFTCFPLTRSHDEVLFLRVLHGSELCFFGIRTCLVGAIESMKLGDLQAAAIELDHSTQYGLLLYRLLKVLTAMPVEHFAEFRDFTSKASALQSINYHLMDIHLRGINTGKVDHFSRVEQLKSLLQYAHPMFVDLGTAMRKWSADELEASGVLEAAHRLDRQLLTWRGLHLSFALKYIPSGQPGTGGTEGAAYLERHRQVGLFDDTEPDYDMIKEIFPDDPHLPNRMRLQSGMGVAPPERFMSGNGLDETGEERK